MFQMMWHVICFTFNLKQYSVKKNEAQRRAMRDSQETEAFLVMSFIVELERKEVEHDCTALCSELLVQPEEALLIV